MSSSSKVVRSVQILTVKILDEARVALAVGDFLDWLQKAALEIRTRAGDGEEDRYVVRIARRMGNRVFGSFTAAKHEDPPGLIDDKDNASALSIPEGKAMDFRSHFMIDVTTGRLAYASAYRAPTFKTLEHHLSGVIQSWVTGSRIDFEPIADPEVMKKWKKAENIKMLTIRIRDDDPIKDFLAFSGEDVGSVEIVIKPQRGGMLKASDELRQKVADLSRDSSTAGVKFMDAQSIMHDLILNKTSQKIELQPTDGTRRTVRDDDVFNALKGVL